MVIRRVSVVFIALVGLAQATPVRAQVMANFFHNVARDFRRNNCWPQPFVCPDRHSVRAPFVLMVHNGWRRQNMLAEHHFEPGSATLSESGQLKVRWIMTQAPEGHRTIYVHQTNSGQQTAARIASVTEFALQFASEGQTPEVLETSIDVAGWPATQIDAIQRAWASSTPEPRLPAHQASTEGE